jgi:uncharacterized integral membrane protein
LTVILDKTFSASPRQSALIGQNRCIALIQINTIIRARVRHSMKSTVNVCLRRREPPMRWIYMAAIVLFAVAVLIFALQNLEPVTVSFLGSRIRAPLAVLAIVIYVLGAVTGGSLLALLRRSYRGSKGPTLAAS